MSLARVIVSPDDFDFVYEHLTIHKATYRNMHMRETRQRSNRRVLRYLHAMHVAEGTSKRIDGMISGPDVFWHYQLVRTALRTQINVISQIADTEARDRILRQFLREVLNRINEEQNSTPHPVTRLHGQYYLKRRIPGMVSNHANCIGAVNSGVLSQLFVSQLAPWNFELLHP